MKLQRFFVLLILLGSLSLVCSAQEQGYLYRTTLVQAAPGKYQELIDAYKAQTARLPEGEEAPLWMRHSQGDHWDLLILWPMGSYAEYDKPERIARRQKAEQEAANKPDWHSLIATEEDVFVYGPPISALRAAFGASKFFHVEMFQASPGRHTELLKEREMENAYQRHLKRPENFIFVRDRGAAWDLFTIGCYRDLKHYAESADIPESDQEQAARAAGFAATSQIGPYLRQFIRSHHDTLAVAVK